MLPKTKPRIDIIAKFLSTIGHPFAFLPFLAGLIAYKYGFLQEAIVPLAIIGIGILVMTFYLYQKTKSGEISNFDVSKQQQRPQIYKVGIGVLSLIVLLLYCTRQPHYLIKGVFFTWLLVLLMWLANMRLKASLHTACATFGALATVPDSPKLAFVLLLFTLLVAWSRLILQRHTAIEIMTGTFIGGIVGTLFCVV